MRESEERYEDLMRNVDQNLREDIEKPGPISDDEFIARRQRAYRAMCAEEGV